MGYFDLEIIKTNNSKTIQVEYIELCGINGNFVVGKNHNPIITILKKDSLLTYKTPDSQDEINLKINDGFFILVDNKSRVFLD